MHSARSDAVFLSQYDTAVTRSFLDTSDSLVRVYLVAYVDIHDWKAQRMKSCERVMGREEAEDRAPFVLQHRRRERGEGESNLISSATNQIPRILPRWPRPSLCVWQMKFLVSIRETTPVLLIRRTSAIPPTCQPSEPRLFFAPAPACLPVPAVQSQSEPLLPCPLP